MTNETFSDRLKLAMQAKQFKQVDLIRAAQRRGVKLGKSHVSQYVSGKTVPRSDILHFLADVLQVDPDWLLAKDSTVNYTADTVSDSTESCSDPSAASLSQKKTGGSPMREFKKSSKLDNVLYDVRGPVVEEANRMEACGTQVLKLNIGNPAPFGFRTPDEVIYDMSHQLTDCEGYSPSQGLFSARKAIMQYAQLKKLPNVSIDDMRKKITDRTKAIVIINPNNPTGALYPKEVLQQIVELAREHQLIIFSDEIYDRLVMDGLEHVSIASLAPDLFCVTFSGLSKSHMIAGFRIGWMILSGNKAIAKDYIEGLKMLSNMRLCSNVPAQSVVQTALGGHQSVNDYIIPGGRIYEQREYVYKAFCDIPGITAVKPKAAFYMFPKIDTKKFNITNDEKFALDLLRDKKLLIVHGGGFNWGQPDHFRVVYLPRIEVLKDAVGKITDFLSYYHQ